jgi:hypothetical protein
VKRVLADATLLAAVLGGGCGGSDADCAGTRVTPRDDLAAVVENGASGERFCLVGGRYRVTRSIKPKERQAIVAESRGGALIDGQGTATDVIASPEARVTIDGVRVTGARYDGIRLSGADSAVVEVESFRNGRRGLTLNGERSRVVGGHYHHNAVYGVGSVRGVDQVWAGVEVSHNRLGRPCDGASGGSKFVQTERLQLRESHFHHNNCNGIWLDINNEDSLVQSNTSSHNQGNGIVCEISYGCLIFDNEVRRNGFAGILVRGSPDVEIAGNVVVANQTSDGGNGDLVLYGVDRTDFPSPRGPHLTRRNRVHHNTVVSTTRTPKIGVIDAGDPDPRALFDRQSNVFQGNNYDVPSCGAALFKWTRSLSWSGWRSIPQDADEDGSCA